MSLNDLVKSAITDTMKFLKTEEFTVSATYSSITMGSYNIADGTMEKTITSRTFEAVKSNFSVDEMDDSIVPSTDAKLIVGAADFGTGEPSYNDTVTIGSENWNVENFKGVPGESVWLIHIRKQ